MVFGCPFGKFRLDPEVLDHSHLDVLPLDVGLGTWQDVGLETGSTPWPVGITLASSSESSMIPQNLNVPWNMRVLDQEWWAWFE